ncbi:MAG: hypothetical protein EAX86_06800 [Candidatus Heimdallarchaeota archaeon]|nr:hypothetical protein [Candidatus Heimdallarchaeota archaeon]
METYAEFISISEDPNNGVLALKPTSISYEEATTIPVGGIEALNFLRQGNLREKRKILINGATGTIGSFVIQLANTLVQK